MPKRKAGRQFRITARCVETVSIVVEWYLRTHYRKLGDPGVPAMFCDPARVGHFAVSEDDLRRGEPATLFRVLIATTMFQRLRDQLILRVLQKMAPADVAEVSSQGRLLALVNRAECEFVKCQRDLLERCDLSKDPATRVGMCSARPEIQCHLKRHTVVLKRYGHFGKVPTSAALALHEAGVKDLPSLRLRVLRESNDPTERALRLEVALCRSWRVNQKIASMFLSVVSTPELSWPDAPWARGVDWTRFVVVDSNVDLFLATIGYRGGTAYDARREFVRHVACEVDLARIDTRLSHGYNPRIVQQAMYLFMSASNRRALASDCMHSPGACTRCPAELRTRCPVRN